MKRARHPQAAGRATKLLDCCVFYPRVKKPQPKGVRWEKTCPRPKVEPPAAVVRCKVTELANVKPVELKTKLPTVQAARRRRAARLDAEQKVFAEQQKIAVSGNGTVGGRPLTPSGYAQVCSRSSTPLSASPLSCLLCLRLFVP